MTCVGLLGTYETVHGTYGNWTIWNIKRSMERVMEKPGNEMDMEERETGEGGLIWAVVVRAAMKTNC